MDEDREIEGTRAPLNFFERGGGGGTGDPACIRNLRMD